MKLNSVQILYEILKAINETISEIFHPGIFVGKIPHNSFIGDRIMTQYCKDLNSLLESLKVQHWYDRNIGENTSVEGDIVSRETKNVEVVYSIR